MEKIPVISMWQPWGNWVSLGWKTIETRTHKRFQKLEGQTIGIHLAQKWDNDWLHLANDYLKPNQCLQTKRFPRIGGSIICTTKVLEFRPLDFSDSNNALIDCDIIQRYGLILGNIKRIEAIPYKGSQGIFYVDKKLFKYSNQGS